MDDLDAPGPFARKLTPGHLIGIDAMVAAAYVAVALLGALGPFSESTLPAWAVVVIVAGVGLPVLARRSWPRSALAVSLSFSVLGVVVDVITDPFLAAAAVMYIVALNEPPRRWIPTKAVGVVSVVALVGITFGGPVGWQAANAGSVALGPVVLGGAWTLGRAIRERRRHADYASRQRAQQAVTEERLRIARELHDIVAHSMSVITVKAGIANHVLSDRPAEAADALQVIESTGRSALNDMRKLLGVLRAESPTTEDGLTTGLGPSPGLKDLPEMVERARQAGVDLDLEINVDVDLPQGVDVSAYRIAQEAVTNVIRHAAPTQCRVRIHAGGGMVTLDVSDGGPGRPRRRTADEATGHGLVGMQERVATYGGEFSAGPREGSGFAVHATLPYAPVDERVASQ